MENSNFKIDSTDYPVYIRDDFSHLANSLKNLGLINRKFCIIVDINVADLYLEEIYNIIKEVSFEIYSFKFQGGEENKNYNVVLKAYELFLQNKLDRDSVVVALGGGIVGDIAGFVASTFMRGISFVQVPTTLLSQIDSSIGGKVGINFENKKNIIGSFYSPKLVYINVATLNSLPKKEFFSGLSEAIKHGLIMDKNYYNYIWHNKESIKKFDNNVLKNIVYGSCKIKLSVVTQDEREKNLRQILNFGHTVGHALESISKFNLSHGYAVSIGMTAEAYLSYLLNKISEKELNGIIKMFKYFHLPTYIEQAETISGKNTENIYNEMLLDKKVKNNVLNIAILKNIGNACVENNIYVDNIYKSINFIMIKNDE